VVPADPVPVLVIKPVLKPLGTAELSQFRGPWKNTFLFRLTVVPPHMMVLELLMSTSPSSSTIVRLIEVGSEKSPGSQVTPGASTAWMIMTTFLVDDAPFPPNATSFRLIRFGLMF